MNEHRQDDPIHNGIHLTKAYSQCGFLPSDLQCNVSKIDDDFTLRDLFSLVDRTEIMIPGIAATFGMSEFRLFWSQINLLRDPDDDNDISYLELFWGPDFDVRTTKKTGKKTDQPHRNYGSTHDEENYWDDYEKGTMWNLMCFHGIGPGCPSKEFHKCDKNCPTDMAYGIEFSPLNNLAHIPIRVSPSVRFPQPFVEADKELKDTNFKFEIEPTLWCFITSIFWELTFGGNTPNKIEEKVDQLNKSFKEDITDGD